MTAIEKWLDEWGGNFYLLPEYRTNGQRIDIALVGPRSFNRCTLDVKTVIEVKGNFASQVNKNNAGEIGKQLDGALEQVRQYKNHTGARFGYVLHLIASPETDDNFAEDVRDGGWRYWREDGLGTMWSALERLDRHVRDNGIRVEGFAELDRPTAGQYFYCYLAKC